MNMKKHLLLVLAIAALLAGCNKGGDPAPEKKTADGTPAVTGATDPKATSPSTLTPPSGAEAKVDPNAAPTPTAVTATAPTGGDPNAKAYTLRIKETKGAKYSYDMSMEMKMKLTVSPEALKQMEAKAGGDPKALASIKKMADPQSMSMKGKVDVAVVDVVGTTTKLENKVNMVDFQGTGQMGGAQAKEAMKKQVNQTVTTEVDEFGTPQGAKVGASQFDFTAAAFPKEPIKKGSTWKTAVKQGAQTISLNAKLVDVEKVKGHDALRIEYSGLSVPGMNLSGPITVWIDPTNGRVLRSLADLTMAGDQMGMKLNGSIKMKQEITK